MKKGGNLEALIQKELEAVGAAIRKADPPFRVLRPLGDGRFEGCYARSGVLDFTGTIAGIHVEFDSKDIKGSRFDFSKITKDQMGWASRIADEGAVCGWAVRLRAERANDDEFWLISHNLVREQIAGGKKSVNSTALHAARVGYAFLLPVVGFGRTLLIRLRELL